MNVLVHLVKAMLGYCQSAALATVAEMAQVLTPMVPHFLFVTAPMDRPPTADYSQAIQNYTRRVEEIVSGKGRALTALINASDSVHLFSVKLSLFLCM